MHLSYWDSCVFLSFLEDTPEQAAIIEQLLDEVLRAPREKRVITSTLSIAEVCYIADSADRDSAAEEAAIDSLWTNTAVIGLVEVHEGIARRARALVRLAHERQLKLHGADAIHPLLAAPAPTATPTATATPVVAPADPTATATATTQPATPQPATPTRNPEQCAAEYPTVCIPPPPPDLDCGDIAFRRFTVLPPDRHRFDNDGNGIGCESG